jgi:HTH-type transcriptional regulator/antitoxin MqsA
MTKHFCQACDDGTVMEFGSKDLVAKVGRASVTAPAIAGWHCPICGDCEFDKGQAARYSQALERLARQALGA